MISDDLDRILASEEPLLPSSGFAASVLERVQETVSAPPPLPFPWLRFLLGLFAVSVLAGISGWTIARLPVAGALNAMFTALQYPRVSQALGGSVASLAGTWLLVRLALGFTGARR